MPAIRFKGVDYTTPTVYVQSDASATDLENTKVPTGQTIKSYLNSKIIYVDASVELTTSTGRTTAVYPTSEYTRGNYDCLGVSLIQNDALYYLCATDGIYPNLSIMIPTADAYRWGVQIMGMNKNLSANRTIGVRFAFVKKS